VLVIDHVGRLAVRASERVAAEGRRLLRLLRPDAPFDVRFRRLDG
jgi:hypothetical protein